LFYTQCSGGERMTCDAMVYIVEDEEPVRKSMGKLMKSVGYRYQEYANGEDFLSALDSDLEPGCILVDVCMPGLSGLELQQVLNDRAIGMPMILISGHADVPMAVKALKAGAEDFIEKPYRSEELIVKIRKCLAGEDKRKKSAELQKRIESRLKLLTPREKDVMFGLADGKRNKEIAADLGLSPRTVEAHRASLMDKLQAKTVSEVVRYAFFENGDLKPE